MRQQQRQCESWWLGKSREQLNAEAQARAAAMSNSYEGPATDSIQGLREHKTAGKAKSKIRLES